VQISEHTAKWIIALGLILVLAGVFFLFWPRRPGWLGRLPGDILIKKPGLTVYFPIATSILASLILSLIFWLMRKF
jgi:hypothetical protein